MLYRLTVATLTAVALILTAPTAAQIGAAVLQPGSPGAVTPVLSAQGPLAQLVPFAGSSIVYDNRTIGTQHVLPPGGCLIFTITGAKSCLQDATFTVNKVSIATPAQLAAAGLSNATSAANIKANNAACSLAKPTVTSVYEKSGCVLSEALKATTGLAGSNVPNSFVCESSDISTTSTDAAYPAAVCKAATRLAGQAVSSGKAKAASGNPCTASRATYIISNPCVTQNTTVNGTATFFNAKDTPASVAPAPAPEAALAPGSNSPAMSPAAAVAPITPKAVAALGLGKASSPLRAAGPAPVPDSVISAVPPTAAPTAAVVVAKSSGASCGQLSSSMIAGVAGVMMCLAVVA